MWNEEWTPTYRVHVARRVVAVDDTDGGDCGHGQDCHDTFDYCVLRHGNDMSFMNGASSSCVERLAVVSKALLRTRQRALLCRKSDR